MKVFDLHVHEFPQEICVAGGTVFFARLRTSPVKLKRGMCNLISFLLGMEKPEFCFCMSYLKSNPNPNKTKLAVDVKHSHVKHCSPVEHRFLFSRITGEREALSFDETLR